MSSEVTNKAVNSNQAFQHRKNNHPNLGSKVGIAALSAVTGGVLTWAAMAHGGLGVQQQPTHNLPVEEAALRDGTYTGVGFAASGGDIVVTITVANGQITDINADYPLEPPMSGEINEAHIPVLIEAALSAQSSEISNITGATVTTEAFQGSLQDALNQARGGASGPIVGAVPLPAPAPATPHAPTPAAPSANNLHDGVFFGEGFSSGPGGNTYVTMMVVDGKIAGVSATYPIGNEESAGISAGAIPTLVTEAKEAQSADIAVVTGATHTSEAFKQSLQDAINQAQAGTSTAPALGALSDGTFVGNPASTGRAGDAVVTITVSGGQITDVTADMPDHEWGEHSNASLIPVMVAEAKETQSAHLTNITGATGSSTAFRASLQSAINQARG